VFGHQPDYVTPAYDPDKARQLMKDAGLATGAKMRVDAQVATYDFGKPFLDASIGLWKDIGIESEARTIEVNIWRDRLYGRETQGRPGAFLMGWSSFLYEAGLAWGWHASDNPYALWKNKAFDDAQAMANSMVDATERMKYYRLMAEQEKVDNGGPSAFIAESTQAVAFKTTVLDASSYKAWLAPEIYFNEVLPA